MWLEDEIMRKDLECLAECESIPWKKIKGKTILVTGATGVIGYNLIIGLIYMELTKKLNLKVIAIVRNKTKAKQKFESLLNYCNSLEFIEGIVENLPKIECEIDYIIHGASPTASDYFINNPVETIKTSVIGTINMLELAKKQNVSGFVFLSSMEVYGSSKSEDVLNEEDVNYLNPLNVRNCYPQSKRECESLCVSYASEYKIPAMSIRLAQTFGLGVETNDKRVFAEFARCVIERKNIVLLTDGCSKRCYLYAMDAVSAILTVLLKGDAGNAYNAANPKTYCSISDMAEMVAKKFGGNSIKVEFSENNENKKKFSPAHFYNLGIDRITKIGWKPTRNLEEMYLSLIHYWNSI